MHRTLRTLTAALATLPALPAAADTITFEFRPLTNPNTAIGSLTVSHPTSTLANGFSITTPGTVNLMVTSFSFDFASIGGPTLGPADPFFTGPAGLFSANGSTLDYPGNSGVTQVVFSNQPQNDVVRLFFATGAGLDSAQFSINGAFTDAIHGDWVRSVPTPGTAALLAAGALAATRRRRP